MLAFSVVNKHVHLAFNNLKALSAEAREGKKTPLNHAFFFDKAVVELNGLTNHLRSG